MKKYIDSKGLVDGESNRQKYSFMTDFYKNMEKYETENFIVPWQLSKSIEEKKLIH